MVNVLSTDNKTKHCNNYQSFRCLAKLDNLTASNIRLWQFPDYCFVMDLCIWNGATIVCIVVKHFLSNHRPLNLWVNPFSSLKLSWCFENWNEISSHCFQTTENIKNQTEKTAAISGNRWLFGDPLFNWLLYCECMWRNKVCRVIFDFQGVCEWSKWDDAFQIYHHGMILCGFLRTNSK